eukprot:SAG11_NODE_7797_length_1094_cov_0.917671_1_plen_68_part_01
MVYRGTTCSTHTADRWMLATQFSTIFYFVFYIFNDFSTENLGTTLLNLLRALTPLPQALPGQVSLSLR